MLLNLGIILAIVLGIIMVIIAFNLGLILMYVLTISLTTYPLMLDPSTKTKDPECVDLIFTLETTPKIANHGAS